MDKDHLEQRRGLEIKASCEKLAAEYKATAVQCKLLTGNRFVQETRVAVAAII